MQLYGPNANTSIQENDISTFENFLKNPETSIPLDSNFLIAFNTIPNGIKNTFNDNEIGHYEPEAWGINVEKESLIKNKVDTVSILNNAETPSCNFIQKD